MVDPSHILLSWFWPRFLNTAAMGCKSNMVRSSLPASKLRKADTRKARELQDRVVILEQRINYSICIYITVGQRIGVNLKSCNVWILCWNYNTVSFEQRINYSICIYITVGQRIGVNLKSCNVWILCWDNIPLANTKTPHVLHLSIILLVLVLSVAMELQNRQCTIRSHGSIRDNFL